MYVSVASKVVLPPHSEETKSPHASLREMQLVINPGDHENFETIKED
jgi:hypothetical protein